jgi:hypothetical protein
MNLAVHFTFANHQLMLFHSHFAASDAHPAPPAEHHWTRQIVSGDRFLLRSFAVSATSAQSRPGRPGDQPETIDCSPKAIVPTGQNHRIGDDDDLGIEVFEWIFIGMFRISHASKCPERLVIPVKNLQHRTIIKNHLCLSIKGHSIPIMLRDSSTCHPSVQQTGLLQIDRWSESISSRTIVGSSSLVPGVCSIPLNVPASVQTPPEKNHRLW